jgi:hypothetical protein
MNILEETQGAASGEGLLEKLLESRRIDRENEK